MAQVGSRGHDPTPIGEIAAPAFARLPQPHLLFARRAERLRALAHGHELKSYLLFLADLCAVQHAIQEGVPDSVPPDAAAIARAREFAMPPLDRTRFTADPACDAAIERLVTSAGDLEMPAAARAALLKTRAAGPDVTAEMVRSVLANSIPVEAIAEHAFVAAALQVHFARLAARLDGATLVPVGDGACPACGGPPVSSMVVGWPGAHGARFCVCSLCATLWNYVRIKCTLCGSTKGISYREVDGGPATVKAEICESCRGYVKILHQHKDPEADPVADDIASLGLDLLVRETGFWRGGFNPFLLGY